MRIAILGIKGLPSRFGADRVVEGIVQEYADRHRVTVYACGALFPDRPRCDGFRQVYVPSLPGKHLRMISVMFFSALHALLRGRYDLIHLHNFEAGFIVPLLRLRFRVISTSHGPAYQRMKWSRGARRIMEWIDGVTIRFSNGLTAVSKTQAIEYVRRFEKPVRWIPNGVAHPQPYDVVAGERILTAAGAPTEGFLLFLAGRIIPTKGCHTFLEAVRRIETDLPIVIVGDLASMPEYAKQLRDLAPVNCHFVGFVSEPSALFGLASRARLFVFPSTVEAMSMALLEVAGLGVPILASDIPENCSVVEPEHVTFFRSDDVEDLAARLATCLDDPAAMAVRAKECQAFVQENYRWPAIARQYEEAYEEVVAGRVPGR